MTREDALAAFRNPDVTRDELVAELRNPCAAAGGAAFDDVVAAAWELAQLDAPTTDAAAEKIVVELAVPGLLDDYKRRRTEGLPLPHAYLWALLDSVRVAEFQK